MSCLNSKLIQINVGGLVFETLPSTLNRYPNALLANEKRLSKYWVSHRKQYFFDRSRRSFVEIFNYYQTGEIKKPPAVSLSEFLDEIDFFELGKDAFYQVLKSEEIEELCEDEKLPKNRYKRIIWIVFNNPLSCPLATAIFVTRMLLVLHIIVLSFVASSGDRITVITYTICQILSLAGTIEAKYARLVPTMFRILQLCRVVEIMQSSDSYIGGSLIKALQSSLTAVASIFSVIIIMSIFFGLMAYFIEPASSGNGSLVATVREGAMSIAGGLRIRSVS
ncbi:hypothetical protein ACOME3_007311 [Neoechinorhynchus agilis]